MKNNNQITQRLKISAIFVLSAVYCLVAVGVWMVQQGKTDTFADTISSYPAPLFSDLYTHFTKTQQTCLLEAMQGEQLAAILVSKDQPTNDQVTLINACLIPEASQ